MLPKLCSVFLLLFAQQVVVGELGRILRIEPTTALEQRELAEVRERVRVARDALNDANELYGKVRADIAIAHGMKLDEGNCVWSTGDYLASGFGSKEANEAANNEYARLRQCGPFATFTDDLKHLVERGID